MKDDMLTIPVQATMRRQEDGSYKMVDAEYAEISARDFAAFLIRGFGLEPILRRDAEENHV